MLLMQALPTTGTHAERLAAAHLLKQYATALADQLSRHQHAAHVLQALLLEQVQSQICCMFLQTL